MLEKMPMPNFWRAPVDNDLGNHGPARQAQWKIASTSLLLGCSDWTQERMTDVKEEAGSVTVSFRYAMPTQPASACEVSYRVTGDGAVHVKLSYDPVEGLCDMPEFGMLFQMNADYDNVTWYGLGPQETYADRKHGAKLGLYQNKVMDNFAKYLVPQECGNKMGVRFATVTDAKGRGLLFAGDEINFSALPYTPHEMENASHAYELPNVHHTYIRAALAQMGVAGDDSWGAPVHPEYLIDVSKKLEFSFVFKGV